MMFAAWTALGMRIQVLIEEREVIQQSEKSGGTGDQQQCDHEGWTVTRLLAGSGHEVPRGKHAHGKVMNDCSAGKVSRNGDRASGGRLNVPYSQNIKPILIAIVVKMHSSRTAALDRMKSRKSSNGDASASSSGSGSLCRASPRGASLQTAMNMQTPIGSAIDHNSWNE